MHEPIIPCTKYGIGYKYRIIGFLLIKSQLHNDKVYDSHNPHIMLAKSTTIYFLKEI